MIRKSFRIASFVLLLSTNAFPKGVDNHTPIFHTLQPKINLYSIDRVNIKDENIDSIVYLPKEIDQSDIITDTRQEWIDRYLSVSYPLSKIIVTSQFGNRKDPFTGKSAKHNGLDLRAKYEEVYAMMYGQVIKIGSDKRSGNYITIKHGDYTVSYCHLSQVLVKNGQLIAPGEPVAISGNTGRSTAPHLHITLKYKRERINPIIILDYIKMIREDALKSLL